MGLLLSLAFALQLSIMLTACAAPTPIAPPPSNPSWHWEWASDKGEGTSEQFACDRTYWTASGYQTAPAGTRMEIQWIGPPPEPACSG